MNGGSTAPRGARRKRARARAVKVAVAVLLAAPRIPSSAALKLASISEDHGPLSSGLLRTMEVVRSRYERAWALVSAPEPSADDLATALELLQANAEQWENLEPAVKLWTEREAEGTDDVGGQSSSTVASSSRSKSAEEDARYVHQGKGPFPSLLSSSLDVSVQGIPGEVDTTSRIYEDAASLLAHNQAVLGQALARSGQTNRGIAELEVACPEILENHQNTHGRRDSSKSWLHCYANLVEMYKTQNRFEEAASLLARMPWLSNARGHEGAGSTTPIEDAIVTTEEVSSLSDEAGAVASAAGDETFNARDMEVVDGGQEVDNPGVDTSAVVAASVAEDNDSESCSSIGAGDCETEGQTLSDVGTLSPEGSSPPEDDELSGVDSSSSGAGRQESSAARGGTGGARVAGLSKVAAAASVAAESIEDAEAARALVERHAEAMRTSLNEVVGELAVTTVTRPNASQEWLKSHVVAAEEVLAAVRAGLLAGNPVSSDEQSAEDVSVLPVGSPGHADVLREASHYLSAIKGVAAQGWAYVDNELHRMERHPAQPVKPGFQSRREVIHTFRYLLMKARQYASENQGQSAAGAGGSQPSRSRRKDKSKKDSNLSKTSRKGTSNRKSSSRSQSGSSSSSKEGDGFLTLFMAAGFALLVVAFSSRRGGPGGGGGGGHGRRRDVVRQRTATRAAKTVGRYVQPPQRGVIIAFLLQAWSCFKRPCITAMARANTSASLARALFLSACATVLKRLRTARDAAVSVFGSRPLATAGVTARAAVRGGVRRTANSHHGQQGNKHRSKKSSRKGTPAPTPLVQQGMTAGTLPVSPRASPESAKSEASGAPAEKEAASFVHAKEEGAFDEGGAGGQAVDSSSTAKVAVDSKPTNGGVEQDEVVAVRNSELERTPPTPPDEQLPLTKEGDKRDVTAINRSEAMSASSPTVDSPPEMKPPAMAEAAVKLATEIAVEVAFPEAMTAEQVQAIVEEDERAWEQARSAERQETNKPDDGWSEVGGGTSGGSRGHGNVNGEGRGRVLSMQNVHAASRGRASQAPPRPCSPGSDPATTTSASSSDGSEGNEERKPTGHHHHMSMPMSMPSQHRGRESEAKDGRVAAASRAGNRPATGTARGGGAVSRASGAGGNKARSFQASGSGRASAGSGQTRSVRPQPVRGSQVHMRAHSIHVDTASSRPTRPSYAPGGTGRANSAPQLTQGPSGGGGGKLRKSPGQKVLRAVPGNDSGRVRNASPWKVLPSSAGNPSDKVTQRSIQLEFRLTDSTAPEEERQSKDDVTVVERKEVDSEAVGEECEAGTAAAEVAAPAAWTNSPSHPLGMKVEQQPLPPASQPLRPPPRHQQHWERRQLRQQQQQQPQPLYYHHEQEIITMPMAMPPAPPMTHQQQQLVAGGHHFSTQSLPPHQGPYEHQYPHQHEMMMPQYLPPPADDAFTPPPSSNINTAAGAAPPLTAVAAPIMYPPHANIHASSPSSVDGGGGSAGGSGEARFHSQEGSYDSAGGGGNSSTAVAGTAGFSPDAAAVLVPPAPMVLMPPQQQPPLEGVNVVGGPSAVYVGSHGAGYGSTSGVGDEAAEALIGTLCWQVEYYFSAENLVNDSYLRGLMDADGYVAVSQIMVFNRVRAMTSDISIVLEAMRRSSELDLLEQDHQEEARVRTQHEPLHWTQKQQLHVDGAPAFPLEPERAPHESEQAFFTGAGGLGEAAVPHDQQQTVSP